MNFRYLLNLIFPLILFTGFSGDKITWHTWNEGYEKAITEGKLILIDVHTSWCSWCKKMERKTYRNENIVNMVNQNFVAISLDPEDEEAQYRIKDRVLSAREFLDEFTKGDKTYYPTTIIIFPGKRRFILEQGYRDPEDFSKILNRAIAERDKVIEEEKESCPID